MANKQVGIEISTKDTASHKIDEIIKKLDKISATIGKINTNQINLVGSDNVVMINSAINGINKMGTEAKKVDKTFKDMFSVARISAFAYSLKNIFNQFARLTKESADFVENINLTEVAFHGNTEAVKELYSTMSDLYNLDESQIVRRIGVFKQMANAMGLSEEAGENLSELLNKMTVDVASLYNISIERASNALQSALVGQTRPIRGATGADITEKTLERTTQAIVPDRYIRDLSFLEKRLVMIISLTDQLSNSQGDWARTIESTDNQLRILNEQTTRFSRALGNLLMPIIERLLPYLNALMMILTEIVNALARLVGFKLPKFDYSSLKGVSDGAMDIEDQMNNAAGGAAKLKKEMTGLRAFDKLNVISTPKTGGSSGIGSGIDPRIMEAFNQAVKDYDDLMDKVHTKASKIASKVLETLGFIKLSNGEWKFVGNTVQKVLGIVAGLLLTIKLIRGAIKLISWVKTLTDTNKLAGNLKTSHDVLGKIQVGLMAIGLYAGGILLVGDAFSSIKEEGIKWGNALEMLLGVLSGGFATLIVAVGILGAELTVATAGISLLVGAIVVLIGGLVSSASELSKAEKDVRAYDETLKSLNNTAKENYETTLANTLIAERNLEELKKLYDANGKLTGSYEEAETKLKLINDALGTEYKLNKDGTITIDGKRYSLEKLEEQIYKNISAMKAEAIVEAYRPVYVENVKKQIEMSEKYEKKQDELIKQLENYDKLDEKSKKRWREENKKLEEDLNTYKNAYETSTNAIIQYEKLVENAQKGTAEGMREAQKNAQNMSKETQKSVETTFAETAIKAGMSIEAIEKELNKRLTGVNTLYFDLRMEAKAFDKLQKELNKLGVKLSPTLKSGVYATGGFPPMGQMFIANEKGPEVVSTLGGKSVVANMEQMMLYLDRRIDNKLGGNNKQKQPAILNINVGSKEIAKVVLDDLNDIAKNNGQALRIGV